MTIWLADFKDERGFSGYYQVEELSTHLTHAVVEKMTRTTAFWRLSEIVGYHPARTFLLVRCKTLIRPFARACVVADNLPPGDPRMEDRAAITDPVLYFLLREVWPSLRVHLDLKRGWFDVSILHTKVRRWMRELLRVVPSARVSTSSSIDLVAGVECNQLDFTRGITLGWLNTIPPNRVILCFNHPAHPIHKATLVDLEKRGFRWVSLTRGAVDGNTSAWRPGARWRKTVAQYREVVSIRKAKDALEHWVACAALFLLQRVDHWRAFFSQHNIQIYVLSSVEWEDNIAKRIAIALEGGAQMFLQRSHLAWQWESLGRRPAHVLLSWGDPEAATGRGNENYNDYFVITGLNDENAFAEGKVQGEEYRQQLAQAGARFVIALFDNGYHTDMMFSRSTVVSFYRHFLSWVLEQGDNGLVIKPKHRTRPQGLSEVRDLLTAVEASGRCLTLKADEGPHIAAFAADLCVGLGHSSAVVVSAIAGRRAVHCDLGGTPNHPLASWGLGRVLFHDLETLGKAIEEYREFPSRSLLGDFTPVLDDLDPFRDGRAGERVGTYIRWLLEAFDAGHDRDTAIRQANEKYTAMWGADKVIRLQGVDTIEERMTGALQ